MRAGSVRRSPPTCSCWWTRWHWVETALGGTGAVAFLGIRVRLGLPRSCVIPSTSGLAPRALPQRYAGAMYLFLLLMQAAFSFRPRLLLWTGLCGAVAWTLGFLWILTRPETITDPPSVVGRAAMLTAYAATASAATRAAMSGYGHPEDLDRAMRRLTRGESPEDVIDDQLLADYAIAGTPAECLAQCRVYAEAGVTELALAPVGDRGVDDIARLARARG